MRVLITGTSSGIGLATAKLFCELGYEVIGFDIHNPCLTHFNFFHHFVDVRKPETFPVLDKVDYIVNNAGTVDDEDSLDTNVRGYVNIVNRYFSDNCKSIVNIASISAHCGLDTALYCASQGARITLTKHWAIELGKINKCRVNSISPGAVMTGLEPELYNVKRLVDAVANESILKKWDTCENVAKWIHFVLCVDTSMTGQDVLVDNGESSNRNFIHV